MELRKPLFVLLLLHTVFSFEISIFSDMASASKGKGRLRGAKGKDYDLLAEFDDKAELSSWAKEQGLFQSGTTKGQWSNNSKKVTTDGIKTFFRCRAFGRKRQQDPPCAASVGIFQRTAPSCVSFSSSMLSLHSPSGLFRTMSNANPLFMLFGALMERNKESRTGSAVATLA